METSEKEASVRRKRTCCCLSFFSFSRNTYPPVMDFSAPLIAVTVCFKSQVYRAGSAWCGGDGFVKYKVKYHQVYYFSPLHVHGTQHQVMAWREVQVSRMYSQCTYTPLVAGDSTPWHPTRYTPHVLVRYLLPTLSVHTDTCTSITHPSIARINCSRATWNCREDDDDEK